MPRIAIVLRGLGFRKGGYGSRSIGSQDSYQEQMDACRSHIALCRAIEAKGYKVDILLDTYSTQYNQEVIEIYQPYITQYKFHKQTLPHQQHMIHDCVSMFQGCHGLYDCVLFLRFDILLKSEFINVYNPSIDKVMFLCICWWKDRKTHLGNPRNVDAIHHIPRRLYPVLATFANIFCEHNFLDHIPLKLGEDYDVMTKKYYDANSESDLNPYFKIVGRPESTIWHSPDKLFPEDY